MPRKSTKVVDVNATASTSEVTPTPAATPAAASNPPAESNTKKRAPVKRTNKKVDALQNTTPPVVNETASPIQIADSVNTFNINIKHVSDDGNNVENTFSTSYSHTSKNNIISDNNSNSRSTCDSDSDSDNNSHRDDSDSDEDSDYDIKFRNSSLSLPGSASSAMSSSIISSSAISSEDENPLYTTQQIHYDILIPFVLINMHASSRENIMALLHTTLISCIEGRCITEGFIKPHSTRIIDFKCGKIVARNVQFNIVIECLVCNPPAQSIISCVAKNITQAGIRALSDDEYSPIVVYITRDFSIDSDKTYYNSVKEGDKINIRVIGKRFEMNDKHIQIIGFLVHPKKERGGVAGSSHSKKSLVAPTGSTTSSSAPASSSSSLVATEAKEDVVTKTTSKNGGSGAGAAKRAPRKTKNPLSIVNDTDNNVITITYDASVDLPKETKVSKTPKTPKEPKKPKKESGGAAVAVTNE